MIDPADITRELESLAADLKRLEAEYNMFFAGRLPRPPYETRGRVEASIKRWDRGQIQSTGDRFRFETLQSRFQTLSDLWDRGMRARDEGRPGAFARAVARKRSKPKAADTSRIVTVTAFRDPGREIDKLHSLYDSLMDARRQAGEEMVPFHKFATLVRDQARKLRDAGSSEVAFRVTVKDGKVNFTVRGLKGAKG